MKKPAIPFPWRGSLPAVLMTAGAVLLYAVVIWGSFLRIPLDSDYASLVLEASDILSGNILLSGWDLTGISFLTTDLLYFILATALLGVSPYAFYLAGTLMFLALMTGAFLLVRGKSGRETACNTLLLVALAGLPATSAVLLLRAHTGAFVWLFLGMWCVSRILADEHTAMRRYAFVAVLCALGVIGDMISLLVFGLPVVIVCIRKLFSAGTRKSRAYLGIGAAAVLGTAVGFLMDKLYFFIGGANKNQVISFDHFAGWEGIWKNAGDYIQGLLRLAGADFLEQPLFSLETVGYAVRTVLLIAGLVVVVSNVVRCIRDPEAPAVDSILSMGFVLLSAAFLVTTVSQGAYSMRYMSYASVLFAVLLIRRGQQKGVFERAAAGGRWKVRQIVLVLSCLLIVAFLRVPPASYTPQLQDTLGEALRQEGLSNGYAGFWSAPHTGVVTNGEVSVRGIRYMQGELRPYRWFSKDDWYDVPAHFIVTDPVDTFSISKQNVEELLGPPDRTLVVNKYTVMIYDRDISGELAR